MRQPLKGIVATTVDGIHWYPAIPAGTVSTLNGSELANHISGRVGLIDEFSDDLTGPLVPTRLSVVLEIEAVLGNAVEADSQPGQHLLEIVVVF